MSKAKLKLKGFVGDILGKKFKNLNDLDIPQEIKFDYVLDHIQSSLDSAVDYGMNPTAGNEKKFSIYTDLVYEALKHL